MGSNLKVILAGVIVLFFIACKEKKKPDTREKFFPALSYIKSQVAKVDTSLYSIMRITFIDTITIDTQYLKREDFKEAAKDFLSLPDIHDPKYRDSYTEDNQFDETTGRVQIDYTPVEANKEEIQHQTVLIKPDSPEDRVTTIIINTNISNKDSSIEKKMLWKVDESFQVTTIKQYPGKPEITSTYKVTWNESDPE
ncbi:MAG: hypothetical protein ABIR18_14690 [Chitinophagaceae bacterium]